MDEEENKGQKGETMRRKETKAMNGIALIPNPSLGMTDTKEEKGGEEGKGKKFKTGKKWPPGGESDSEWPKLPEPRELPFRVKPTNHHHHYL